MRSPVLLAAASAALTTLTTSLAAQGPTFTSPYGFDTVEGSSKHDYILFSYNRMRWQQMDSTAIGTGAKVLRSIAWRRDATSAATAQYTARTLDIAILMADAQPVAATSTNFDSNYLRPPTTVFTLKSVNLPDWTAPPATTPAPFNAKLTFDVPWVYLGQSAFLWEVRADNNTGIGSTYGNDFQSQSGSLSFGTNTGTALGTGCVVGGQAAPFQLDCTINNYATNFRITATASRGPASAPTVLHVDVSNANLTVPGLCATVLALPRLSLAMGNTNAMGTATLLVDNIPWNPTIVGAQLFLQAAALDASQPVIPIALSNGRQNTVPTTPNPPGTSRIYEYWITTSMRAPSAWTGGLIAQFEY